MLKLQHFIGGKRPPFAAAKVTALTVPLVAGMWNAPALHAQSKAAGSATQTQDITGERQGSLKDGDREEQVVFRISLEDSKLKAVLYRVGQGGRGEPATTIARNGSAIRVALAAIGVAYEGRMT
jgi:hypothetical protein